ncbi:MAG: hypothetical protein QM758_29985 [Armatimonas sp.]
MNDEDLREQLNSAPVPPPVGGHEATRERLMDRVRQTFPVDAPAPSVTKSVWWHSRTTAGAGAALLMAGLAAAAFFLWSAPQQDRLPDDAALFQLYDQHQFHHDSHFAETSEAG